ncbi:MAG: hypothetical protein H7176_09615 [Bdellovibrionales bacterium]|nr:hypothetical protein [Massilia sp.]
MMKIVSKLLLALTGVVLSACAPSTPATLLDIQVGRTDFVLNGHSYATTAELTTALKRLPSPDGINLIHAEGATLERTNEAIAAVKNAGIKAPIGWVGNEVFY